ncbi:MAG: hypothetical protein ACE5DL_00715 [Nitrosopumilaceae archaeon]
MEKQKKNAIIVFAGIAFFIVIIVGVSMIFLPDKPETTQDEKSNDQNDIVSYDPEIVTEAEKGIPEFQNLFSTILRECNDVNSSADYDIFMSVYSLTNEDFAQTIYEIDSALAFLEESGYQKHSTLGPMIKDTRQLAGISGDCIIKLQNKYED